MRKIIESIKNLSMDSLISSMKKITFRNIYEAILNRKIDFVALLLVFTFYVPKVDELRLYKNLKDYSVSTWIIFIIVLAVIIFYLFKCRRRILDFFKDHYYILTAYLMFLSFPVYDVWIFKGFPFFGFRVRIPAHEGI